MLFGYIVAASLGALAVVLGLVIHHLLQGDPGGPRRKGP